jgi:riboflavin synthase
MFTGLIEAVGVIERADALGNGREFGISTPFTGELAIGDSLAIDGVCLTVVRCDGALAVVQAVEETLSKTILGRREIGHHVNLERAMLPTARMGGHIVQGHVDCVAKVRAITALSLSHEVHFVFPAEFRSLVVPTGSICVNGISLTVARVEDAVTVENVVSGEDAGADGEATAALPGFMVAIIPHTWQVTTMQHLRPGEQVNLEFDIVGKYVRRSIDAWQGVVRK